MRQHANLKLGVFLIVSVMATHAMAQRKVNDLNNLFLALSQNQQFNGNVLVAEDGKIVYEKSFGHADFSSKRLNTKNTSFPLASISKTITATAILQLIEKGMLKLADPVVKYLPDFPYPTITIKHLLSHTSGLPPYNAFFDSAKTKEPEKVFTNSDFISGLVANKKPLLYQPGEKGNYDNINFIVLALMLERVSGTPFSGYVDEQILKPAGMNNTVFFPLSLQYNRSKVEDNFAFPHLYPHAYSDGPIRANTVPYVRGYWHAYSFIGFGDYISTTHDLLKYDRAYSNGRLLSETMLRDAFTPVALNNGNDNPDRYGLGWAVEKDTSLGKIVYHSGAATGLSCVLLRNITKNQTVIVFDNTHYNAHDIATMALKTMNGQQVQYPRKSLAAIYGKVLVSQGADAARDTLERVRRDTVDYVLSEDELNSLGYDFMGDSNPYHMPVEPRYAEALEVFRLNTQLFPASWNVYDSYGEALLKTGKKDDAIRMYQKSIEINPGNQNGKKALERLLK